MQVILTVNINCLLTQYLRKFVKKYPEKFTKNSDHPDTRIHVTRNKTCNENDLFVAHCRNTNFVQNPLIMLARIWNHLLM
jgi:hypothetical protein